MPARFVERLPGEFPGCRVVAQRELPSLMAVYRTVAVRVFDAFWPARL